MCGHFGHKLVTSRGRKTNLSGGQKNNLLGTLRCGLSLVCYEISPLSERQGESTNLATPRHLTAINQSAAWLS